MSRRKKRMVDWRNIFPEEYSQEKLAAEIRSRILKKAPPSRASRIIGTLRERRVFEALRHLQEKREIHGYLQTRKLGNADLIEGVDFIFTYVDNVYRICRFSVTGWRWVSEHLKRHPEIPTFSVGIYESQRSIEQKILNLKNYYHN